MGPRPASCRYVGIRSLEPVGVFLPGDQNYPGGGPFDPLNYAADADGFVEQVRGCGVHAFQVMKRRRSRGPG